jgi:hypothetical protein
MSNVYHIAAVAPAAARGAVDGRGSIAGRGDTMRLDGAWSDLATRGFVVARGFLSADELARLVADYEEVARRPSKLAAYYTGAVTPAVAAPLCAKIEALLPVLRRESGNRADVVSQGGGMYFPTSRTELSWHIDALSYFARQDHYHLLNFWMPIVKPDVRRSGLSLIPMDRLQERAPEVHDMILGRGAARFLDDHVISERDGRVVETRSPVGPEELAETPEVGPGDLIVARCDVFHRTQDVETRRVAISIRAYSREQRIDRDELLTMSPCKYERMLLEHKLFVPLLLSFYRLGKQQITWQEHEACVREHAGREDLAARAMAALYPLLVRVHRLRSQQRVTPYDHRVSSERLAEHYRSIDSPMTFAGANER